jgi:predicted nucleic acid-binding protein
VLVSALLNWDSVPGAVVEEAINGNLIPVLHEKIIAEYEEVLRRDKFPFIENDIQILLNGLKVRGVFWAPALVDEELPDKKDVVFYAVTMEARKNEKEDAYLVTGNIWHFPVRPYIVTPREMLSILQRWNLI